MSVNAAFRLVAGIVILASLALGTYMNPVWYYLTGFAGLNLLQSGLTKWCPAAFMFQKMGLKTECGSVAGMSVHQGVHIIAGTVILTTVALVLFATISQNLLFVTAIVGLSLIQSAFTGWCPAMTVASMLGCRKPAET